MLQLPITGWKNVNSLYLMQDHDYSELESVGNKLSPSTNAYQKTPHASHSFPGIFKGTMCLSNVIIAARHASSFPQIIIPQFLLTSEVPSRIILLMLSLIWQFWNPHLSCCQSKRLIYSKLVLCQNSSQTPKS